MDAAVGGHLKTPNSYVALSTAVFVWLPVRLEAIGARVREPKIRDERLTEG